MQMMLLATALTATAVAAGEGSCAAARKCCDGRDPDCAGRDEDDYYDYARREGRIMFFSGFPLNNWLAVLKVCMLLLYTGCQTNINKPDIQTVQYMYIYTYSIVGSRCPLFTD